LGIQSGLAVTADGGVPILHRAVDGGVGEVSQVVGAMESLRPMCAERSFLLVGDSKLVSCDNLRQIIAAGVDFIAPACQLYLSPEALAACDFDETTAVDYLAQRDAISQRISEAATGLWRTASRWRRPRKPSTPGSICAECSSGRRRRRARRSARPLQGPKRSVATATSRAPSPSNNRRIEALLSVACLALLIFCLVEREARAIAPELKITGLGGYRDARPTGRNLFNAPGELRLIPATTNAPPIVPAPTGLQARILELLDVVPAPLAHSKEPKHMTTRHPLMCGTPG
jgi:hypothetical protein